MGDTSQASALRQHVLDGNLSALAAHDERVLRNYRDKHGSALLHFAAGCGRVDICKYLLQFTDVDVRSVDAHAKGQVTPLELAIWQCHLEAARYLVEELGANPNAHNAWGCTTAHWLGKCPNSDGADSKERLREACDWLFGECGVERNLPNHHGQTPLHKAAYAGNFVVAEYLCALGARDSIRDNNGNTAADCAERGKNHDLAKWLRRHASAEVPDAIRVLGLRGTKHSLVPPDPEAIRRAYMRLARVHHPDVVGPASLQQWNTIRDAYQLLQSWWRDEPDLFDCQIRMRTRNTRLIEHERLCWHPSWHEQQQSTESESMELAEFESRLVRLLSSNAFTESGLCLAQLPREYQKTYHAPVPSPRNHGCRKMIQLLREQCPHVAVEVAEGTKKPSLRVAT